MNTMSFKKSIGLAAMAVALVILGGDFASVSAQRDPFAKPSFMRQREPSRQSSSDAAKPKVPVNFGPPTIEARIDYYKRLRENAVASGQPVPKVTSVLLVSELNVNGVFKTPRGWAAMIEATPIKLSYTIYPGEKFFDGQLVAVEENRLVFRRVTKTAAKKFVASVEYKPLQQYTMKAQIEGTAPMQASNAKPQVAAGEQPAAPVAAPAPIISPLDEMNSLPADKETEKPSKASKRPVKVAKNHK